MPRLWVGRTLLLSGYGSMGLHSLPLYLADTSPPIFGSSLLKPLSTKL